MKQSLIGHQESAGSANGVSASQVGEANIWLVASMLILCLLMVGGLLLFIIGKGLPAFWPKPIDLVVTTSGDLIIGERIRNTADSTLFRIGNSQSSSSAYRLVSKSAFSDAATCRPRWAVRLEQYDSALTYGIPAQIVTDLVPEYREHSALQRIAQLEQELRGQDNQLPASLQSKAVKVLENCRVIMLSQALTSQLRNGYADKYQLQLDHANSWLEFESVPQETISANRLTAARRIIFRPTNLGRELKNQVQGLGRLKQDILNLRRRQRNLKRDQRRIRSLLSSAVTNAGLDASATDAAFDQLDQQARDLRDVVCCERLLDSLRSLVPAPTDLAAALPVIDKLVVDKRQRLQVLTHDFEDALTERLSENANAEVLALCKQYRSKIESSIDLNERLSVLELQIDASNILIAVPDNSEPVEISIAALDSLQPKKELPNNVSKEIGWSNGEVTVDTSCPRAKLLLVEDPSAQQLRVGCIYQQGYLDPLAQSSTRFAEWRYLPLPLASVNGVTYLNELTSLEKLGIYFAEWRTFLFASPDQNTFGGMFPALWGTIVLTLMMTIAVVPVGVIAALFLREYTTSGTLTALIRISINNLAGVPSIVYGVFGLAFFCYTMGAFIDGGPTNADIPPFRVGTWFVLAGILAGLGSTAFFCTLSLTRGSSWPGWKQRLSHFALILWILCGALLLLLIFKSPFFEGFYAQQLPNPTFGKGGILWAALTMALLTLPIVIVCSEEALAAVPVQLREASSACGASKWQTICRIIIPYALPGILTGAVLAMTRGVGQVAPLMLVGALPAVPELPLDTEFPYLHASRSFMHLGYQVYALGIQSRDTEAARPVVFAAILLLVISVASLNLLANHLRSRMRRRIQRQVL